MAYWSIFCVLSRFGIMPYDVTLHSLIGQNVDCRLVGPQIADGYGRQQQTNGLFKTLDEIELQISEEVSWFSYPCTPLSHHTNRNYPAYPQQID